MRSDPVPFLQQLFRLITAVSGCAIDMFKLFFGPDQRYVSHVYVCPGGRDVEQRVFNCRKLIYLLNFSGQCMAEGDRGLQVFYAKLSLWDDWRLSDPYRNNISLGRTIVFDQFRATHQFYQYDYDQSHIFRGRGMVCGGGYVNSSVLRKDFPLFDVLCPLTWPGKDSLPSLFLERVSALYAMRTVHNRQFYCLSDNAQMRLIF